MYFITKLTIRAYFLAYFTCLYVLQVVIVKRNFTLVPEKTEGRKERICGLKKHRAGLIKALQK